MARLRSLIRRSLGPLVPLSLVPLATLYWCAFRSTAALEQKAAVDADPIRASMPDLQWQGVASCASTACHGGNGERGSKGSEYTTWVLDDKHTKAYLILFDDRSQVIERNLRQLKSVSEAHAEKDQLCLNCHAMNADHGRQRESFVRDFGIGCESCHGPAEKWIGLHYGRDWSTKSVSEKQALGLRPLKSLADRAELCVTCHIGDAGKDVNHDLIAAGHPRLNFEFGAFQAIMPKHWREEGENAQLDFEARAWVIGQVASARASLALLEHRARSTSLPWPEFAEFDCFACHHELREPSWRQEPGRYANRMPGTFAWGTWYYPLLAQALPGPSAREDAHVLSVLSELKKEMQKPSPNRKRVADQARQASTELAQFLGGVERIHYERTALERKCASIRGKEGQAATANWDGATQVYLALSALYNAITDMDPRHRDPALRDALKAQAKRLEFPKAYDSPRGFEPKLSGEIREKVPR